MNRSLIKSVCNTFTEHAYLLAVMLVCIAYAQGLYRTAVIVIAFLYTYRRAGRNALLCLMLCTAAVIVPRYSSKPPDIREGRVVRITEYGAVVRCKRNSILVYTKEIPVLDSVVAFSGEPAPLIASPKFYGVNTERMHRMQGIRYSLYAGTVQEIKPSRSVRGFLQRRISVHRDAKLLMRILLCTRDSAADTSSVMLDGGMSYAGLLMALDQLLKYSLDRESRRRTILIICAIFCIIYRFPLTLLQGLVYRALTVRGLAREKSTGTACLITVVLCPWAVLSASFWIPFVYRSVRCFAGNVKGTLWFAGMIMQSLFFCCVNPFTAWLYSVVSTCYGTLYLIGILSLFVPVLSVSALFGIYDSVFSLLNAFVLPGSILGSGLVFFLAVLLFLYRQKQSIWLYCGWLLVFLTFGLFHPFAEVSFINVGQGDAILIRTPLNRCSIMIDTGKPSQSRTVDTFLKAKGVRTIDILFISHSDSDHSGNTEFIQNSYIVYRTVTEHFVSMDCGGIVFTDLNTIDDEDANRSSLVQYFELNGISYLMMGDADKLTEEQIVRDYGSLRATVLKASHHGSATGSSQLFLETVRPHLAVISCGAYGIYHHPSREVTERFRQNRIPYTDTRSQGDITILCLPGFNLMITAGGRIGIVR